PKRSVYDLAFVTGPNIPPGGASLVFLDGLGRLCGFHPRGDGVRLLGVSAGLRPRTLCSLPSGKGVTFTTKSGKFAILDLASGTVRGTSQTAYHTTLGPDGRWVAVADPARRIVVRSLEEHYPPLVLPPEEGDVWSVAWAPDG